jgi:hypothetical protein
MIFRGGHRQPFLEAAKQECREVFSVEVATLVYLDWSDRTITFDRDDHRTTSRTLGDIHLLSTPIIDNRRLTQVFMDEGSSLNIIYADTLELLGVGRS